MNAYIFKKVMMVKFKREVLITVDGLCWIILLWLFWI